MPSTHRCYSPDPSGGVGKCHPMTEQECKAASMQWCEHKVSQRQLAPSPVVSSGGGLSDAVTVSPPQSQGTAPAADCGPSILTIALVVTNIIAGIVIISLVISRRRGRSQESQDKSASAVPEVEACAATQPKL